MQRWVRTRKVERMLAEGWKKTDVERADGAQVLMEKKEAAPAKPKKVRKPKEEETAGND